MQATARGGLTGKARQNRHRNRAYRMHAQQMLEEYLDADEPQERTRPIPLRGRAEFLPTADRWTDCDSEFETNTQLELTLEPPNVADELESYTLAADTAPIPVVQECADESALQSAASDQSGRPVVIPAPYWARPRASFQPQGGRPVDRNFDLKRFVYGCALGTAAAAAILLMANVIFS